MPISSEFAPLANSIAIIGIRVSGKAVPIAENTLPTTPCPKFNFLPNHSIAFVKIKQAKRIKDKHRISITTLKII